MGRKALCTWLKFAHGAVSHQHCNSDLLVFWRTCWVAVAVSATLFTPVQPELNKPALPSHVAFLWDLQSVFSPTGIATTMCWYAASLVCWGSSSCLCDIVRSGTAYCQSKWCDQDILLESKHALSVQHTACHTHSKALAQDCAMWMLAKLQYPSPVHQCNALM